MARLPRDSRTRSLVLVLTIVIVAAAVSVSPGVFDLSRLTESPPYAGDGLVPERAPAAGEVTVQRRPETGTVLVDVAHENRMDVEELQPLLSAITAAGYQVDLLESSDDLDRSLARSDAFVVIDPSARYAEDEAVRVQTFVERGGRLLLVGEPTQIEVTGIQLVTQTNRLTPLASQFGIEFGQAHLFNMETNDGNHLNVFAEPTGSSTVTDGLSTVTMYTATTVQTRDGQPVLVANDGTRSSRSDVTGTYPVAAVDGNVLAVGDSTFLSDGNFNVVDNEQFIGNIVRFLVSGSKEGSLEAYPAFVGDEPRIHYTGPALLPAAQQLGTDLREQGHHPRISLGTRNVAPDQTDVLVTTYDFLERRGELETGITAADGRIRVRGYESDATGIIVLHAPASGYDLVIAADTPARVRQAVGLLTSGDFTQHVLNDWTAVIRTGDAIRLVGGQSS